ncbi:hypothetical protein [Halostagnicola bangensis]
MSETVLETFVEQASDPVMITGFSQILTAIALAALVIALTSLVLGVVYARELDFEREVVRRRATPLSRR